MGDCESTNNRQEDNFNKIGIRKIPESMQPGSEMHPINVPISKTIKSLCKVITPKETGSGFLIKFFKDQQDFFCLMTNEHVVKKEFIKKKKTITFYYDSGAKTREIQLNPEERFIKDFTDMYIDATVIEILPKDDIPKDYFLTVLLDYLINYKQLVGQEITIIQYPKGELNYSHGFIKNLTQDEKYGFVHGASTLGGSSGSPIFLKGTTKVIGIHKASDDKKIVNFGDFIYPIFNYFRNFSRKNNEINVLVNERKNNDIPIQNNSSLNQMTIIYEIEEYVSRVSLFGEDFVKHNKSRCYLLIDGQKMELCKYLDLTRNQKTNGILEIKLIEKKIITDMSYMFNYCRSLKSLPDISKWDTKNVKNMSWMFMDCESLIPLPDISKWDTKNVSNMSYMFSSCTSLMSLPDISKWDIKNVNNMESMFDYCSSLVSLPDISKWDTKNVRNMSCIFFHCISLIFLPDISKWNTKNVINMSAMFDSCSSLKSLPDISKWDTKNVIGMSWMFNYCSSLKYLPDISKWDTKNVIDMSYMFDHCSSLKSLPDISKWDTKNVTDMSWMFFNCSSLNSLPDISKWDTKNVRFMTCMFNSPEYIKSFLENIS